MKFKRLITTVIILSAFSIYGQDKAFSKLQFDKVIMYDFIGGKGAESLYIIDDDGNLSNTARKKVTLDKGTVKILNAKLEDKKSYGAGTAACFIPHLGIVYYLKNKPVAHISVCMDCNRLHSSKDLAAQKQGKTGNGEDSYYLLEGMSTSFRNFINNLLKKYNFSHQIKK